jgi:hypothetical protein
MFQSILAVYMTQPDDTKRYLDSDHYLVVKIAADYDLSIWNKTHCSVSISIITVSL